MSDPITFGVAVAAGMVRSGTPVLLATVGECLTERSGILNLGVEGIMLSGALVAVVVSYYTGNVVLAVLAALIVGAILGLVHGIFCLKFKTNQVATGIAMTIFLSGITAFFGVEFVGKTIHSISSCKIPLLGDIPVIGPILFCQDPLVYACYLIVPAVYFLIAHTRFGLAVRAVGEEPRAAQSQGVDVTRVRYIATIAGAALAALGGAYLSLVYTQGWIENITAGRGWIAVGLVMFAHWNPMRALVGAYLFGVAISLQLRLQAAGSEVSPYLLGMLPYVLVIAAMAVTSAARRTKISGYPAALGVPYVEQV